MLSYWYDVEYKIFEGYTYIFCHDFFVVMSVRSTVRLGYLLSIFYKGK